ncbi:26S proteasome non-ATPase regulatory subunit 4-like isoform X2 [Antedon mediterranea]|uniref:26S proteasome non-ATPase regulatory subunit 4-like isoform X2 n=1 Tax=Antedon mediterranea TaxID=105859 RepID=UPI003AF90AEA
MVLESTIVCVDTSEYMRNGDFVPTRIQAQQDAVNLVCSSKTRSNPENNVGLITMANVKVLVTLTTDVGRILATLHQMRPSGKMTFLTGVRVAHLALKHRQSKNHRMRIIVFVGSPLESEEKELLKLAKKLKKEKVNVDIINFGEDNVNTEKLTSFVNTINGKEGTGSNLVTIPPGTLLSEALRQSPIVMGEDGSGAMPSMPGGSGGEFEFGFDPASDPELAMALRISMEEQRQRHDVENLQPSIEETAMVTNAPTSAMQVEADSEDALLEQALAMSRDQPVSADTADTDISPMPDLGAMTEEEQIAYAMQMSLQASSLELADLESTESKETPMDTDSSNPTPMDADAEDLAEVMSDPAFLQRVLQNLPGVDPSSDAIRNAMGSLTQQDESKETKEDKKDGQ